MDGMKLAQLNEQRDWLSRPGASLHNDEVLLLIDEVIRLKQLCLKAANHKWGEYLGNGDMVMRDLLQLEVE
jgi:hypothetical protein